MISMILLFGCSNNTEDVNQTEEKYLTLQGDIELLTTEIENLREEISAISDTNEFYQKEIKRLESKDSELMTIIKNNKYDLSQVDIFINYLYRQYGFSQSFAKASEEYSEVYGYITEINDENSKIYIDECEFLGLDDVERLEELGLDPDRDLPSAFYIHNPDETPHSYEFNESTRYVIYTYYDEYKEELVEKSRFSSRIPVKYRFYLLKIFNNTVLEASEVLTP